VRPEVYHQLRYPAQLPQLMAAIETFVLAYRTRRDAGHDVPFVELQLVDTDVVGTRADVEALTDIVAVRNWGDVVTIRTTADCFSEMSGRADEGSKPRNAELCINPFASVSVAQDGTVLSCCFIFDPTPESPNVYGNLRDASLAEVWAGRRVKELQSSHRSGEYVGQCRTCYLRSPMSIHLNIVSRMVQRRRKTKAVK